MGEPSLACGACPYITLVRKNAEARIVLVIFALLMTFGEAMAHEHHDRFLLYTGCDSMELYVGVDIENSSLSLSPENVRTAVEARLRAARLYQADDGDDSTLPSQYLVVEVSGASVAFSVRLQFYRILAWDSGAPLLRWWRQEYPDGREPTLPRGRIEPLGLMTEPQTPFSQSFPNSWTVSWSTTFVSTQGLAESVRE